MNKQPKWIEMNKQVRSLLVLLILGVWAGLAGRACAASILPATGNTLMTDLVASQGIAFYGSSPYANSWFTNAVTTWTDAEGNNVFSYGTDTHNQPQYIAKALNGQPGLSFNWPGLHAILKYSTSSISNNLTSANLGNAFTCFLVTSGATNPIGAFDSAPNSASTFRFYNDAGNNGNCGVSIWNNSPTAPLTLNSNGTVVAVSFNATAGGGKRLLTVTTHSIVGGQLGTTVNSYTGTVTTGASVWVSPGIGGINGTGNSANLLIEELAVYQGNLSASDFKNVLASLDATYLGVRTKGTLICFK